jgi:hypothetical protein
MEIDPAMYGMTSVWRRRRGIRNMVSTATTSLGCWAAMVPLTDSDNTKIQKKRKRTASGEHQDRKSSCASMVPTYRASGQAIC